MSFDYCKSANHPYNTMSSTTTTSSCSDDETMNSSTDGPAGFRKGPWTVEEDIALVNYIAVYGEGRWNSLASCAGLKRTGKSCRLRWLNYLRPDVRRGNITPEEQLLILQLHSRWGNRWSKIAQYLPGRTDNEIKNYWRTRVQKHAKQLKCDVNSQQFKDTLQYLWIPRLVEKIKSSASNSSIATAASPPLITTNTTSSSTTFNHHLGEGDFHPPQQQQQQQYDHHAPNTNNNWQLSAAIPLGSTTVPSSNNYSVDIAASDNSSISTDSMGNSQLGHSPVSTGGSGGGHEYLYPYPTTCSNTGIDGAETAASLYDFQGGADHQNMNQYAAVDSEINPISVSNYFNQYLAGGLEFDYQGLDEDSDYPKLNDVDISLWNGVEDVNSYDYLLLADNQISPTSSTVYF